MPQIHLVVGEKGGVGKSQVALALAAYYTLRGEMIVVCEADRSNGDVGRALEGKDGHTVLYPYFSEDNNHTDKADEMLDAVLEHSTAAIVNCPAQSHRAIVQWIEQGSTNLAMEFGVTLHFWFVTSGGYDSISLFLESLNEFSSIPHILVRNTFFTEPLTYDYSDPEKNEPVAKALTQYSVPVVRFPRFATSDLDYIKAHNLTFLEAINQPGLKIAARSRVKQALAKFVDSITPLEVFNEQPNSSIPRSEKSSTQQSKQRTSRKSTGRKKRSNTKASMGDNSKNTSSS